MLVSGSLECGDDCAKSTEIIEVSDGTRNQCSLYFSSSSESGSGSIAHSISSPRTEWPGEKLSVHNAVDLLCGLHLNEPENVQRCSNQPFFHSSPDIAEVSCLERGEAVSCKDICNGAMAPLVSDPLQCCDSLKCVDAAVNSDESNSVTDADITSIHKYAETDKTENDETETGAIFPRLQSDSIDSTTERCRHATADSSSSMRDYTAAGCDIVFSDGIEYRPYGCERHLHEIIELVSRDLSEPYSIYTYRYFIYNWPNLCFRVSVTWSTVSIVVYMCQFVLVAVLHCHITSAYHM